MKRTSNTILNNITAIKKRNHESSLHVAMSLRYPTTVSFNKSEIYNKREVGIYDKNRNIIYVVPTDKLNGIIKSDYGEYFTVNVLDADRIKHRILF